MRALDKCALATLGGVLGYAAFQWGGVVRTGRYEYLLALGVLAIVLTLGRSPEAWPPLPPRRIKIRVERLFRAPGPQEVRMTLAPISHHVWTLLVGCRKGGASAPPESRPPPSVGPVPRAGHGTQEYPGRPCDGGAEAPPFQPRGQKCGLVLACTKHRYFGHEKG